MTKQPESRGSSLPPNDSVLPSSFGIKQKPKPNSLNASSSNEKKLRSSKSQNSNSKKSKTEPTDSADKPKSKDLKSFAPRHRRRSGAPRSPIADQSLTRDQPLTLKRRETADPFAIFAAPEVDQKLLGQSLDQVLNDDDFEESEGKNFRRLVPLPAFLVSLAIHLAVFLGLAFMVYRASAPPRPAISLIAEFDSTPTQIKPSDVATPKLIEIEIPDESHSEVDLIADATSNKDSMEVTSAELTPNLAIENPDPGPVNVEAPAAPVATLPTGGGLEGREEASRSKLAAQRGGSRASETAVENGIRWIINHQRDDGSWHFHHHGEKCDGSCRNEGSRESTTAATGLALMSMLGAGYTQRSGPYKKEVRAGLDYLLGKLKVGPHGGSLVQGQSGMYSHAIATVALCEAYIMTRDTSLIDSIDEARRFIESAQHKKGGWRYVPGTAGDMTVTGWQIMALKSCEMAGFKSDEATWKRAESFINSLGSSDGQYGYQHPDARTSTTTAVGMLSKMYLGDALEDDRLELGAQFLANQKPSKTDLYFNYYATLVLHHRQDAAWEEWNVELRDYLVNTQDKSNTHQSGSWYFADKHAKVGGRLFTTAMAVMTLEVYYRYMPLYDRKSVE